MHQIFIDSEPCILENPILHMRFVGQNLNRVKLHTKVGCTYSPRDVVLMQHGEAMVLSVISASEATSFYVTSAAEIAVKIHHGVPL